MSLPSRTHNFAATKNAICGICPAGCWVTVTFDAKGRIDRVRADESSDLGAICKLGEHSSEIVYSPDRLQHPLKRVGPKGSYKFERISWDEAFNTIVARLQAIKAQEGPEATAIYTGRGSFELSLCDVFQPQGVAVSSASSVLFPFGSPNTMGVGALCYVSFAMIAPHLTAGGMLINMFSDIENAELIVVWGANPATDSPPFDLKRIMLARKRGAHVVVIDPRKTLTAKLTDAQWIPIRPGTDGALALGMINVLIEEELYDEQFTTEWTHGFDDLARYVQHYRPETVAAITGVPATTIRSLAIRIAEARGAAPVMYSGLEYSNSGVQAIRATLSLWALAGQLDVPGGRCFTMPDNLFPINRSGQVPNPNPKKALARDKFPLYSSYRGESHAMALPEAVLEGNPYRIRALINLGGSIITAWPQPSLWRKTLGALDFLVCIDRWFTADAAYADIVLPATTYYEIESYMTYGPLFRIRERLIEPVGEARNDFFILAELANRLGYGHLYPQNEHALLHHALTGSGFTPEEVRAMGGTVQMPPAMMQYKKWEKSLLRDDDEPGFNTPTGKFELHSTILEEHGYDPLPVYTEPQEGPLSRPDLLEKFPLIFNSGSRVTTDFRSQFHGIPGLASERPEPTVTINSKDAARRGIDNGAEVYLKTPRGQVKFRAYVTDDIVPGTLDASMGGGGPVGPQAWQDCNVNDLTDIDNYDPISGFPVYKTLLCEVEKVGKESASSIGIDSGEAMDLNFNLAAATIGSPKRVYLDHNATTQMDPDVRQAMDPYMMDTYGNPSSIHSQGTEARLAINGARRQVAQLLNCAAKRIVFTASGSEANNLAIKGMALALKDKGRHIITSNIEHPAVLLTCLWLRNLGFEITSLTSDNTGRIDPELFARAIKPDTILATIMLANNETGAIQPIAEMARKARDKGVIFHSDAVQAVGKIPVDIETLGVDMLTLSAHKFYGPKGIGALYLRKGVELEPLLHGGKQENGLRAGTENVAGIIGFGKAAELATMRLSDMQKVARLRDRLERGIKAIDANAKINGPLQDRLPNTLNMVLQGYRGESVVLAMDQKGISLSSGSACRSGSPDPSHALLAMGLSTEEAHCSVRLSLGLNTTVEDIDYTLENLGQVLKETSNAVRFSPCR